MESNADSQSQGNSPSNCDLNGAVVAVSSIAVSACSAQVSPFSFENYRSDAMNAVSGVGNVDWNCTGTATVRFALRTGQSSSFARQMKRVATPTATLNYQIYLDAVGSAVWRGGSSATQAFPASAPSGRFLLYGVIPSRQQVPLGQYQDTLLLQVDF